MRARVKDDRQISRGTHDRRDLLTGLPTETTKGLSKRAWRHPRLAQGCGPETFLLSMSAPLNWPRNRLLLALPASDLRRLVPELKRVPCESEQLLIDADSPLDHIFFPDSGVVSAVAVYADGSIIEMATIGREGCTGVQAIVGAERSSVRLLVQIPGSAAKMPRAAFTQAMASMPSFRTLMHAYLQAFLQQILVSVACNGTHSVKQRLARWLLMMLTAVTITHWRSLRPSSPRCWACTGRPSRMLPESWNGPG